MIGLLTLLLFGLILLIVLLTLMLAREMRRPPRHTAAYAIARNWPVDPGELALKFDEWNLDRPHGTVLPVWEIQTPRGGDTEVTEDSKLTIVFVHGWGHSRIDSLHRIEPFLPLCDRIVMYDLRGHGEASGGQSRLGDGEELDLLALLERLGRDHSFVLVGHSMGAVIAIQAALAESPASSRIEGIIAYGPYCEFHQSLQGRLKVAGYPRRPITDLALLTLRFFGIKPPDLREQHLSTMPCPLLVIHGANDPVSPVEHGRRIVGAAPNAKLCEMTDAAHTDAYRCDPTRHDALVREFIEGLRPDRLQTKSPGAEVPGPSILTA